jgi:hypothetical protein
MIWILSVMLSYGEVDESRMSYLQDMHFISESKCQDYLFNNKVMLVDSLLEEFRNYNNMKLTGFDYFCESKFVELDEV